MTSSADFFQVVRNLLTEEEVQIYKSKLIVKNLYYYHSPRILFSLTGYFVSYKSTALIYDRINAHFADSGRAYLSTRKHPCMT